MSMKVLDGDGVAYYIDAEGAGSVGDPAKIKRVLEGGYHVCEIEFTRPANTTAYSALDCLADNAPSITTQVLAGAARKVGGSGAILRAVLKTDKVDWTNPINLVIYKLAPGAFIADNSPFDRMYADKAKAIGMIEFPSFATVTGGAGSFRWAAVEGLNIPFACDAALADLYFQAYIPSGTPTPASGQKFYLQVGVLRD
jgi:hypothetical protein